MKFYDDLVKDKIVIFNMMYAKCEGKCTPITRNLVQLQKVLGDRVGKDIFMYSFTLNAESRTRPTALKHYAHMHKVKPGWLFLTGSVEDMETMRRKLGYVDPDPEVDKDKSQPHRRDQVWQRTTRTMGRLPGNVNRRNGLRKR